MEWKDAIVFISSTFNDMHAERDYLVKEVFPELTEWCEKRHIRLKDIDLRWGVSEEDSSNKKTIQTCLEHVDKSRPFFLCFLGQRRGWVPDFNKDISKETKDTYGFDELKDKYAKTDYATDRSATELEIEHALLEPLRISLEGGKELNQPECRHSLFFFRDGKFVEDIKKEQKLVYTNEYLKKVDISKVMGKLEGNDHEKGRDPELYDFILDEIKKNYESSEEFQMLLAELIYDIQKTDCEFYNNLVNSLVENPTEKCNLSIIAELKFKNPKIYKELSHEIKENDETAYSKLMGELEGYKYLDFGIDNFYELFKKDVIKEVIDEIKETNEKVFNVHEKELVNLRNLIKDKRDKAEISNESLAEKDKVHVLIKEYEGTWKPDRKLPELSHYKFNEGQGRLADFECDGKPLKKVIIDEFKKQLEQEFKTYIEEIANENPNIFAGEEEEMKERGIIEIDPSKATSHVIDKKLSNELDQQENFCHNNSEGFVERTEYTNKLKEYVESSDNKICLVSAEAGLGKTMLLADFATNFEKYCPKRKLYKRFCGGSDLSSKTYLLWKSIVDEAGIEDTEEFYPHNIVDLRRNIDEILTKISEGDNVVILIDAVNQMEDGMEMFNWLGKLPNKLKLIISVKEVNLDDNSKKTEEEKKKDKEYHDLLENIKNKKSISPEKEHSFKLDKLDHEKEECIADYVEKIKSYVDSSDSDVCLVSSDMNYDKSLIFHIFNDKYPNDKIKNFRCILKDSSCPTDKMKKSVREFGENKTDLNFVEITGKCEKIIEKIESHIAEISNDEILIIDILNNDDKLFEKLSDINFPSKTILGIKKRKDKKTPNINKSDSSFDLLELDPDKNKIISNYLKNYLKELDEKEIHDICNFKGSKNPLFLKILLSELRVFGSFDQLKDEIKSFGDSPSTAFNHVFERLEKDEKERGEQDKPIVESLFSLLATSRVGGLSEEELVTIIKNKTDFDEDYVFSSVNLNLRQVRPFMARKEGRHDFFYEKFRESAEKRYGDNYDDDIELLRDYFRDDSDPNEARRYVELPYYLNESGPEYVGELEDTLSSYSFIKNKILYSGDVYGLIQDYNYLDFEKDGDGPLELIQRALDLSSPVLVNNPEKLPEQLWGRMNEIKEDPTKDKPGKYARIDTLLDDLVNDTTKEWLKPTTGVLYSPKSSIIKRLLPDGNKSSSSISFTDGNKILFGSSDGVLSLYDLKTNTYEVLERENSKIVKFILKDDDWFYVARANGEIRRWNVVTQHEDEFPIIDTNGEDADLKDIYVSDTYNKIYAVSHKGIFSINLETNELKPELLSEDKDYNSILVPRRNEAILVCDEKEVDGWDVYEMRKAYNKHHQNNPDDEGREEGSADTKRDSSTDIKFMGLNKRFLTLISENGQMKFWNTLKNSGGGESIDETFVCGFNDKFTQAVTLEDENQIITMSDMGVLRVWDIPQPRQPNFNKVIDIQTGIKTPTSIDYRNDGKNKWVIVGNESNDVSIIDLKKKVEANDNVKHDESVLSIKIDGNKMITASENGEVYTWNLESEEFINKYANEFRCDCLSYNRKDRKLVLAGVKYEKDGRTKNKIATCTIDDSMWDKVLPDEGEKEKVLELGADDYSVGSIDKVIDIAQNESEIIFIEGNNLTIGGAKETLDETATTLTTKFDSADVFVGFESGNIVKYPDKTSFNKSTDSITKIKVTDDKVIAGDENGLINIFELDGSFIKSLNGHKKAITNIDVIDGSQIVTISKDNTLKIWDIENAECTYTYFLDIYATSVSVQGDKFVVGDTLGNVRFFKFEN